jgi:GMP synthase (glutamine-hydrolysing)
LIELADLDTSAFIEGQVIAIRETIGNEKALVAVSGGVDSTVSALITNKALGDNLICVFIDDNFMRLGEAEQVKNILSNEPLNLNVRIVTERQKFMTAMEGLSDAEEKRKAFRKTFYETLKSVADEENCKYLIQGTIRADVEETTQGVKTQHNVLEQIGINPIDRFGFNVVEPLKNLYKSQVREVARSLGVSSPVSERQPFPGPGLSIRVVGEITAEKLEEIKKATFIVEQMFETHNPSQYFAAIFSGEQNRELKVLRREAANITGIESIYIKAGFLSENVTGIIDGSRVYGSVTTLSIQDAGDNTVEANYDQLNLILNYLKDNYPETTRLIYLIKEKNRDGYSLVMRAVKTRDFLEAESMRLPWITLKEAASKILESCASVARVYYDITPKPPATIEYE